MSNNDSNKGEIVMYHPDETIRLEVKVENESVWLSQAQMADLFGTQRPAITKHLNNIYKCGELTEKSTCSILEHMGNDGKQQYITKFYNLDAIISVGFRVNTKRGIEFRQWANQILKDYLLKGYVVNKRITVLEHQVADLTEKVNFFVHSSLPPIEGIFYDGQIFDTCQHNHDRFLIIDDVVYLFGACLKNAGKKLFAYIKMQETPAKQLLDNIR